MPKIDLTKYVGKKVKIVNADVYEGMYGHYVKFETGIIDTIDVGREPITIKASVIFGLQTDKDGQVGWGEETKLGLCLSKYNADSLEAMKGKEVLVQIKTNKDKVDFLTIA